MNSGSLARTEENAHMIADEDQRGCNGSPDLSGKPPPNTNRTQFSPSQTAQKCNQKKCDKSGNKEKGEKKEEKKKKMGEYAGTCPKMKLFTKRVVFRRKASARKVFNNSCK